jgi:hypothetical protein
VYNTINAVEAAPVNTNDASMSCGWPSRESVQKVTRVVPKAPGEEASDQSALLLKVSERGAETEAHSDADQTVEPQCPW